jgi:hypothetical protein
MRKVHWNWLLQSVVLAVLLVGAAFLVVLGEPRNPDLGTSALLAAGFGLPWLVLNSGIVESAVIIPTPLLIAAWSLHFVLLAALFYGIQVGFDRWRNGRREASA